jgi:hypothetical protein
MHSHSFPDSGKSPICCPRVFSSFPLLRQTSVLLDGFHDVADHIRNGFWIFGLYVVPAVCIDNESRVCREVSLLTAVFIVCTANVFIRLFRHFWGRRPLACRQNQ